MLMFYRLLAFIFNNRACNRALRTKLRERDKRVRRSRYYKSERSRFMQRYV